MSLFEGAAQAYRLYRPGIPEDVVNCLASTVSGIDNPALLDLGTGTGQVPVALGSRMGRVDVVDPDAGMLAEAERLLRPLLNPIPVGAHQCAAEDFYAPFPGYTADLVTFSRSFHWMPQAGRLLRHLGLGTAMTITRANWSQHYDDEKGFRPLGNEEKSLLVEHLPEPEDGRVLDVGCGSGELAAFLSGLGYAVDAADFADGALTCAREQREDLKGVRWLCLDIEHDDPAALHDGYDLITLRLTVAFLQDRCRVMRNLGARLRPGGALVVITPVVQNTPEERRHIALDEDEINLPTEGFEQVKRFDAAGLAVLVLQGGRSPRWRRVGPSPRRCSVRVWWLPTTAAGYSWAAPRAKCGSSQPGGLRPVNPPRPQPCENSRKKPA